MSGWPMLDRAVRRVAEDVRRDAERQLRELAPRRTRATHPEWWPTVTASMAADIARVRGARINGPGDRYMFLNPPLDQDRPECPNRIEVTALGWPGPQYVCGCGQCHKPLVCICGDRGTHRPEPGIGCTRPGCLCLEPAEPVARAGRPPNPGRRVLA